jgi:hypothetical protein
MLETILGTLSRLARSTGWVSAENLPMRKVIVRALLFREGDQWCAQCLDFDIAVQARSRNELLSELTHVLIAHVEIAIDSGHEPFIGLPKAPARYFDSFARSEPLATTIKPIKVLNRDEAPSIVPEFRYLHPVQA